MSLSSDRTLVDRTPCSFFFAAALAATTAIVASAAEFKPLFNGKDLDAWEQKGGKASYTVEDGMIVGTTVAGTPNSFLCTRKHYSDFILEFEFKVDPILNSGVQFRSQCFDVPTVFVERDKTQEIPAGRVHGYQCEIDMDPKRDRWWTAGIYEEGRRGWLYPGRDGGDTKAFTDQGRQVSLHDTWNRVRIEASGDSLKTWLNGVQRAEVTDKLLTSGFIALQVHGIGNNKEHVGMKVSWRNLRIEELKRTAAAASNNDTH